MKRERCAVPGCERPAIHRHHLVLVQHLRWVGGYRTLVKDERNIVLVCGDHHFSHHNASRRLPASLFDEEALQFADEVFGTFAPLYIERYYE